MLLYLLCNNLFTNISVPAFNKLHFTKFSENKCIFHLRSVRVMKSVIQKLIHDKKKLNVQIFAGNDYQLLPFLTYTRGSLASLGTHSANYEISIYIIIWYHQLYAYTSRQPRVARLPFGTLIRSSKKSFEAAYVVSVTCFCALRAHCARDGGIFSSIKLFCKDG